MINLRKMLALLLTLATLLSVSPVALAAEVADAPQEPETAGTVEEETEPAAEPEDTPMAMADEVANGTCGENLTWTLDSDGVLTISGTWEMYNYDFIDLEPPWYEKQSAISSVVIESGITSIGDGAFNGCSSLTNVTIPGSVTSIGESAFSWCTSLTSVTIPDGITSIGNYAFCTCTSLTSVTIPGSVNSIGAYAFYRCTSLTSVTISDGMTSIGDYAFLDCTGLTSVTIPDSVTSIGDNAFSGCTSLTSVIIPSSVTSIGNDAFSGCTSLTSITVDKTNSSYSSQEGVLFNKEKTGLIYFPGGKAGDYTIPDGVTSIGEGAFYLCTSLTSVTIPGSVTNIGQDAFYGCTSLTSVMILNGVTSIGDWAFYYCTGLASVTIPDSVTSIGKGTFYLCTSLTSAIIPDNVTSIGDYAFCTCTSLTSVTIPGSVNSIGEGAFSWCTSLTSVTIPDSVNSIGNDAFAYCDKLTIYGYTGTAAETYANENGIPFVALDASTNLATPTLVSAANTAKGVTVTWKAVTGAAKYRVYYSTNGGAKWSGYKETTGTSYTFTGGKSGTTYTYTVRAVNGSTLSSYNKTGISIMKLSTPTLVSAANTAQGVTVTWKAVSGAANYRVYYSTNGGSSWKLGKSGVTGTSYTFTGGASGTTYTYTVRAVNGSTLSYYNKTGVSVMKLSIPTLVSAANTAQGVTVTWKAVTGATSYNVYVSTNGGSSWKLGKSGVTGTSYTFTGGSSGKTYTYTVRAVNGSTLSYYNKTGVSVMKLSIPTVTLKNTANGIAVSWNQIGGAEGYYVYRKAAEGKYALIATINSGSTVSYSDTAVKSNNGTAYTYAVRAYNGKTTSYYTGKATVRLTAPTISSVTNSASGAMTVNWSQNSSATGYQVYYKTGSTAKTVTVKGSASLSKAITGLTKGSTYTVYVRSYKTVSGVNYYSAWSVSKTVKINK